MASFLRGRSFDVIFNLRYFYSDSPQCEIQVVWYGSIYLQAPLLPQQHNVNKSRGVRDWLSHFLDYFFVFFFLSFMTQLLTMCKYIWWCTLYPNFITSSAPKHYSWDNELLYRGWLKHIKGLVVTCEKVKAN